MTNDIKINPLILKLDSKKFLSLIGGEAVDDINEEVVNILNRTILDDAEDNIAVSYEDLLSIIKSSTESYIVNAKVDDFENNVEHIVKQLLQANDIKDEVKGVVLNFRFNSNFSLSVLTEGIGSLVEDTNKKYNILWSTTIDDEIRNNSEITAIIFV